jgi:type VI secretion system secreted protein VgrG
MEVQLLLDGKKTDPSLGIVEGYIEEGINQVSFIELLTVSEIELTEEELEEMVGKSAALTFTESVNGSLQVSRFDGVIYEVHEPNPFTVEKNKYLYRLIIRPRVWKLSIGNNARSFPNKSRVQVIQAVLEEHGFIKGHHFDTEYFNESAYPTLSQILQCEVSDWMFLRQLMNEAGINFYFGAEKSGEKAEMLYLIDHTAPYPKGCEEKIPWRPSSQLTTARHISSFETQVRTVPSIVNATAMLGDGQVKTYNATESLPKGKGSVYQFYCAGGQDASVAKHAATVLSQCFETLRITYQGESNHFLLRAGERFVIDGPSSAKQKEVLVTSVKHHIEQGVDAAVGGSGKLDYRNTFTAVRKKVEIRPLPYTDVIDARKNSTKRTLSRARQSSTDADVSSDRLTSAIHGFGVMVGKVIEDAKTSDGKEITCKIENERFPDGLTIKVSAPWLVPGGGVTSLPRIGMQVYFMLVQGEGGGHEGVMLGYRPTGEVPGLNPAKKTETAILKAGPKPELDKPGKPVVEKSSVSPSNRQRNALSGEGGVCEMAVIDGPDATMSLSANKTISLTSQSDMNISSKNHMQMADVANEQFGELTIGVSGDCTESINGNHQFSLQGNQEMFVAGNITRTVSGDIEESVSGNKTGKVSGNLENTISGNVKETVSGNKETRVSGNNKTTTSGNEEIKTDSDMKLSASGKCEIGSGGDMKINSGANLEANAGSNVSISAGSEMKITGTTKLELVCGGGSLSIDAAGNVTINGIKVDIVGSAPVSINGAMVKINA